MLTTLERFKVNAALEISDEAGCRLWIDGVGSWLVWFCDELTFGNAACTGRDFDRFKIFSDVKTRHATWSRRSGRDWLKPIGPVWRNGVPIENEITLSSGDHLQLGDDLLLSYSVPSPLGRSAVWRTESGHRAASGVDGLITFESTCLLGRGEQNHIRCPHWESTLILFLRDGKLWGRMQHAGQTGTVKTGPGAGDQPFPICDGTQIETDAGSLRVEVWKPAV